ncbi:MAG: hypothetical protein ACLFU7_11345 [Armatimonadota bacterium]
MRLTALITITALLSGGIAMAQDNLVTNASFESADAEGVVADGWTSREDGIRVERRTDGGRAGEAYVRFHDDAADTGQFLECGRIPARPGGAYTASAWLRTDDECEPGVYLNFYDQFGTRIEHTYERVSGPTDGWQQVAVTQTAPENAWEVGLAIYAYIGDVGVFDADDAELTVEGGAEPGATGIEPAEPGEAEIYEIGDRLELFVDDFMIDGMSGGVERRLHHPQPREVILQLDRPWEGDTCAYFVVLQDGDAVRMYYRGSSEESGQVACLAESPDGINFERINAGLIEHDGSTDNNIIWQGRGAHNFTPFVDTKPGVPEDERYKAVGYSHHGGGLGVFASPDGIRWRELLDHPAITEGAFDSQNLAFYDPLRGVYVDFHRKVRDGVRDVMTCTSEDFREWTDPVFVEYEDTRKEHLYTNAIQPYARAPHIYVGLPARFVPGRTKHPEHEHNGVSDAVLMSSRDGLNFERWEEAFIRPAAEPEVWTDRNNYPAWGIIQTAPDELSVYWTEHYRHPTMRLRRGTIRTDGFVSVHAGGEQGEILTRPLVFTGERLVVNYATDAVGWLRFELCEVDGTPIDGFSMVDSEMLFGNEIAHEVAWRSEGDLSALAGQPVRLRVRLENADLYSLRFAD